MKEEQWVFTDADPRFGVGGYIGVAHTAYAASLRVPLVFSMDVSLAKSAAAELAEYLQATRPLFALQAVSLLVCV